MSQAFLEESIKKVNILKIEKKTYNLMTPFLNLDTLPENITPESAQGLSKFITDLFKYLQMKYDNIIREIKEVEPAKEFSKPDGSHKEVVGPKR
jgi:hypothetical protein